LPMPVFPLSCGVGKVPAARLTDSSTPLRGTSRGASTGRSLEPPLRHWPRINHGAAPIMPATRLPEDGRCLPIRRPRPGAPSTRPAMRIAPSRARKLRNRRGAPLTALQRGDGQPLRMKTPVITFRPLRGKLTPIADSARMTIALDGPRVLPTERPVLLVLGAGQAAGRPSCCGPG
jgi:hypothetical protein